MRIKRLSALLLSALLITSPIGYMTVNGDTIDAKDYSQQVQSVDSAYIGSYIPSSLDSDAPVYVSDMQHMHREMYHRHTQRMFLHIRRNTHQEIRILMEHVGHSRL